MLKNRILEDLKKAVKDLGYPTTDIVVSISKNSSFGDYTTNVALQLAEMKSLKAKQSSVEIANRILSNLRNLSYLSRVEAAGGGFINFFIKDEWLASNLAKVCNHQLEYSYRTKTEEQGKKVMVEFTDPNPFKEFHIGHLFSNSVGESLARLLEATGQEVRRANYFGDVGMHVAKSIWGMEQLFKKESLTLEQLEKKSLPERIRFLGQSYALGAQAYEENKEIQTQMKDLNFLIYIAAQRYLQQNLSYKPRIDYQVYVKVNEDKLSRVEQLFKKGKEWSLEYFESIYAILGTKFDYYYPESSVAEYGMELVRERMKDKVFEKSQGAIIFPGEKFGLHRRVFINSLGLPTYEAKELGLAIKKYQDYPYDQSIVITGNEIKEYFQVLMMALSKINPALANKTIHIPHGMVRMNQGKISSRTGNVLTFQWLFDAVYDRVSDLMRDSQMPDDEKNQVQQMIAVGAIKFSMLKSSPHTDVVFDLDKSVSLQGDSGPYLQYSYARAKSVLRKDLSNLSNLSVLSLEKEEREILRSIEHFGHIVEEAAQSLHPNTVAAYLINLAKQFNLFYQKHRIINAGEEKKDLRLALTYAVAVVLKQGLYLLGIAAPERM